jgi:hypothetical protein
MPAEKRPTVSEAVTTCLTFCRDSPDPWAIAKLFTDRLRENGEWTPQEVADIERQIRTRLESSEKSKTSPAQGSD